MIKEFYHNFEGYGVHKSRCLVRMFEDDGEYFICFIDIGEGTSVTNASEQLATEVVKMLDLNPEDCRFFETYQQYNYDSFDEVQYEWDGKEALHAAWRPSDKEIQDLFLS